ncbi:MAG: glycolate oxidase subunit GlcF [Pseudomonadota bacterium]
MRTQFTPEQLRDGDMAQSERILRACVHCGFCNATCPTYLQTGDENDGPRGRIYLMREMLQSAAPPDAQTVAHIDRCLSCLGCASTCPSGVDYMRLVDHARAHIEHHYRRPLRDRLFRAALNFILPHASRFALALRIGKLAAPFAALLPARLARMTAMAAQAPAPRKTTGSPGAPQQEGRNPRVALLKGCVQPLLAPQINEAALRLLSRLGVEAAMPENAGCCGALSHHMGRAAAAKNFARANIGAWMQGAAGEGLRAILMTASGCGTQVKEYGRLLREDESFAKDTAYVSSLTRDISEFLYEMELPQPVAPPGLRVAYHAPCSLQHGQKLRGQVEALLRKAGFTVLIPRDAHLCCGAAGSYTLLQAEMSARLTAAKAQALEALAPDVIVSGNVGCQTQIATASAIPVLHWIELLDWAYGGPPPCPTPS